MKRGITLSIMAIAVSIMFIVIGTATIIGTNTMKAASYEEYISKIKRVEDEVNFYMESEGTLPLTGEVLSKSGCKPEFINVLNANGDSQNDLYIIDMNKLNVISVNIGYGNIDDNDIFLITANTNNIYYYGGFKYDGRMVFNIER